MTVLHFTEKHYINNATNIRPDSPSSTSIAPAWINETFFKQDKDWIATH